MSTPRVFVYALTCALAAATPAFADFKLDRQLALQPGGRFILDTDLGDVMLVGDSPSGASVSVTSRRDDLGKRFDFHFEERAGIVEVTVRRRGSWLSGFFGGNWFSWDNTRFAIRVPHETAVEIRTSGGSVEVLKLNGNARARSSGGSLHVEAVEGNVDAHTSGGSIEARQLRGDAVLGTSGGNIEVVDVRGILRAGTSGGGIQIDTVTGDVFADTSGGGIRVRGAGGRVEAHTSGGSVTVGFSPGNNRGGDLSTSGGGVRAELDPATKVSIDASSSGDGVSSDLPVTTRGRISNGSFRGELNGGGPLLRLRSSGGSVQIGSIRGSTDSR